MTERVVNTYVDLEEGTSYFSIWMCYTCGALVENPSLHNEWHNITEAKENICDAQSADGQQSSK